MEELIWSALFIVIMMLVWKYKWKEEFKSYKSIIDFFYDREEE